MSLYRSDTNVTGNGAGECLRYEINTNKPSTYWIHCTDVHKTICAFNNGSVQEINSTTSYLQWLYSMNLCLKFSGHPTSVANLTKFQGRESLTPSWVGVFTSEVIYSHAGDNATTLSQLSWGYLSKYGKKVILQFDDNSENQRPILCEDVVKSTEQPTSASGQETSTSGTESVKPTREQTTNASGFKPKVTKDQGSDAALPAGISAAAVLVIAVIIAILVLKRKKRLLFCKQTTMKNRSDNNDQDTKPRYDTADRRVQSPAYDTIYDTAGEPINEEDDGAEVLSNNDHAQNYFVLDPHEREDDNINALYNTTDTAQKCNRVDKGNVYNTLKTDIDTTYDRAHTKLHFRSNKSSDNYDTAVGTAIKQKDKLSKDSFGESDEDAYNHISQKPIQNSKTDNFYGINEEAKIGEDQFYESREDAYSQ